MDWDNKDLNNSIGLQLDISRNYDCKFGGRVDNKKIKERGGNGIVIHFFCYDVVNNKKEGKYVGLPLLI